MVELAECPAPLKIKKIKDKKAVVKIGWNPIETPQNLSNDELVGDQSAVAMEFERCTSVQLAKREDQLEILN